YTSNQIATKISDLTKRYRQIKSTHITGCSPSDWLHYELIHAILGTCPMNDEALRYETTVIFNESSETNVEQTVPLPCTPDTDIVLLHHDYYTRSQQDPSDLTTDTISTTANFSLADIPLTSPLSTQQLLATTVATVDVLRKTEMDNISKVYTVRKRPNIERNDLFRELVSEIKENNMMTRKVDN
ncbi:unnamed protein product, partial [Didymodactylos carnosus]